MKRSGIALVMIVLGLTAAVVLACQPGVFARGGQGRGDGSPEALCGYARERMRQGKYDEAQQALNQLQQQHPDYAPGYYTQGEYYESQGNRTGAEEAYRNYVRKSNGQIPPDPEVRIKLRRMGLY